MALRENEIARQTAMGLELRADPLRVKWEFLDLLTADGHQLRCQFSASVRAVPDRTERAALAEVLLDGRTALFGEDVARHFFPALRSAANRFTQTHDVAECVEEEISRQSLGETLKAAALPVAFACGLEMMPPFEVELRSPTFERQRVQAMQQALVEKEAVGQVERLARATELLKQFQALRSAAPELSAGQVLEKINSADRGSLMQALLLAGSRQQSSGALWAVAGPYLVQIDARRPIEEHNPPKPRLHPLPPMLGPLRSVQAAEVEGRRLLLIGAQRGFFAVREDDLSNVRAYCDPAFESSLGFNRVAWWASHRQFVASHSEAGIVCWDVDSPDSPIRTVRPAALGIFPSLPADVVQPPSSNSMSIRGGGGLIGPRNVLALNGNSLVFSAGARLMAWDGKSTRTLAEASRSEIVTLLTDGRGLLAIHEDGTVCVLDLDGELLSSARRTGRVRSASLLPWLDGSRLLLASEDGPVQCLGYDDPLLTQYTSVYRDLRAIAGSAAMVAAVSPDRQRLVIWNTWDGQKPAAELFIAAQARHRIADFSFS